MVLIVFFIVCHKSCFHPAVRVNANPAVLQSQIFDMYAHGNMLRGSYHGSHPSNAALPQGFNRPGLAELAQALITN